MRFRKSFYLVEYQELLLQDISNVASDRQTQNPAPTKVLRQSKEDIFHAHSYKTSKYVIEYIFLTLFLGDVQSKYVVKYRQQPSILQRDLQVAQSTSFLVCQR
jgi:hypothetical protein